MAVPTTRTEFRDFCLRKLGFPVIEINVDADQVEDRIDEALKYYYDYHFDGAEMTYYKHQITTTDITNKYITLPENIIGAVRIFPLGVGGGAGNVFSMEYQISLDAWAQMYVGGGLVSYFLNRQNLALVQELLVGQKPIRYTRHKDRVYVDMNWDASLENQWLIVEAYEIVDPDVYTDAWGDRWLANYTTALIKRQWGSNLTKFVGMQLPGGVTYNGEKILDDAVNEIRDLEQRMAMEFSLPPLDRTG